MDIVSATRKESRFVAGVSARGAIALYRAAQAYAAFAGRDYVLPEDVRDLAPYVLCHRLGAATAAWVAESGAFLTKLLEQIPVPLEAL